MADADLAHLRDPDLARMKSLFDALHATKAAVKDYMAPQGMFTDLGIKYVGPVDGHDRAAVERALRRARRFGGPVLVHVITQKGRGYALAEADDADLMHAVGAIDPVTGTPLTPAAPSWTSTPKACTAPSWMWTSRPARAAAPRCWPTCATAWPCCQGL